MTGRVQAYPYNEGRREKKEDSLVRIKEMRKMQIAEEQVRELRQVIARFSDAEFTDRELRTIITTCIRSAGRLGYIRINQEK